MRLVYALLLGFVLDLHAGDDAYQPGPDSLVQPGIPKGELIKGTYTARDSSVFPGTERDYTIYLPAGYVASTGSGPDGKPSPFMVFQDGVIYNAPAVFDNLIAKKEIPPLIGIFIKPGVVPAANPNALPRYNRSYEYDSVTDTYARFLIDEFLPALEAKHGLKLSTDPNDAAIAGVMQAYFQVEGEIARDLNVFNGFGRMCVDTNGWLYVATTLGIQVCDQAGRVNFIIPTPQLPHDVCFGGKDLGELFIACGDKIYKRSTKVHGYISGQMAPIKPPAPKL